MLLEKLQLVLMMYEKIVAIVKAKVFAKTGSGNTFFMKITTTIKCNIVFIKPINTNRKNLKCAADLNS